MLLAVLAVAAGAVAVRYGLRYGEVHRIGDDTYRRDDRWDVLRILVPAAVAAVALLVLALSALTEGGLRDQWRRERTERQQARAWSRRRHG